MKRFLLILVIAFSSTVAFAQKADTLDNNKIFTTPVDVMPEYTGGMGRFYARIERIPYLFLDRMNCREGRTIVLLVIEKNGIVSDVTVLHGISDEENVEVIKTIKKMQHWKPGMQAGKPVRVQYAIPINFLIAKE